MLITNYNYSDDVTGDHNTQLVRGGGEIPNDFTTLNMRYKCRLKAIKSCYESVDFKSECTPRTGAHCW